MHACIDIVHTGESTACICVLEDSDVATGVIRSHIIWEILVLIRLRKLYTRAIVILEDSKVVKRVCALQNGGEIALLQESDTTDAG